MSQCATPYSWESRDLSENDAGLSKSFSGLNVAAKPFVPGGASYALAQPAEPAPQSASGKSYKTALYFITLFNFIRKSMSNRYHLMLNV